MDDYRSRGRYDVRFKPVYKESEMVYLIVPIDAVGEETSVKCPRTAFYTWQCYWMLRIGGGFSASRKT